jgi:hypothetical protein
VSEEIANMQVMSVPMSASLSFCKFKLENHWTDFDKILYGHYCTVGNPKVELFDFKAVDSVNVMDTQTCEVGATLAPLLKCGNHDE